jgi:YgiT-type zinc finger domain-containing protein
MMEVNEEYFIGNDIVYIPIKVLVCKTCGERYYDRRTMQFLEKTEENLSKNKPTLKEIGKIMIYEDTGHAL